MIKPACVDDVKDMARILYNAWQEGFNEVINPEYPKNINAQKYEKIFQDNIVNNIEDVFVFVHKVWRITDSMKA